MSVCSLSICVFVFFVGCLCVCLFLSLLLVSLIFVCLFVSLIALVLEVFCCCRAIIVLVLVVLLVVFIDVSTPRSRMVTPPLPHTPRPRSRVYRRFVTSNRPPAGTPPLFKKTIEKDGKTHHFPPPRRQTRADSSLRPRDTVPELPSGTKACKTSIWPTLITS